jgi:hypothetical protein
MSVATVPMRSPGSGRHLPSDQLLALCLVAASLVVVLPIASFGLCALLLINLSPGTPGETRRALAVLMALSFALMMGARPVAADASNDIEVYYEVYQDLAAGRLEALMRFGGGLEVAFPLLCYLGALLLPALSINGFMFCVALVSALLLVFWLERTFYLDRRGSPPALMGAGLLLLNLYFSTQLTRQFLALVVLLFAFSATTERRRWLFVVLASSFHLTALPFYLLYRVGRRGPAGWVAIILLALAARTYFWDLVAAFEIVPPALAEKLIYYLDNTAEFTEADITSLRMIGLLCALSLIAFAAGRFRLARRDRIWLLLPWAVALVHVILLPIPLASLRATLLIHSIVPGVMAYQMFAARARAMLPAVLNGLLLYKLSTLALAPQSGNLLPSLSMVETFLL